MTTTHRTIEINEDFGPLLLRCPACGNRGRLEDRGSLWLSAPVRIDSDGLPSTVLGPDEAGDVDCTRCDHVAPMSAFLPPWAPCTEFPSTGDGQTWPSLPGGIPALDLVEDDRAAERAWLDQAQTP